MINLQSGDLSLDDDDDYCYYLISETLSALWPSVLGGIEEPLQQHIHWATFTWACSRDAVTQGSSWLFHVLWHSEALTTLIFHCKASVCFTAAAPCADFCPTLLWAKRWCLWMLLCRLGFLKSPWVSVVFGASPTARQTISLRYDMEKCTWHRKSWTNLKGSVYDNERTHKKELK